MKDKYTKEGLRIIRTARSKEAINEATKKGYWPLVKPVVRNPEIKSKLAVIQNPETGEIEVLADYRGNKLINGKPANTVIDFTYYYPYHFENPYAAYLIPSDLKVGEKVFIEDLIEDIIGSRWNQSDCYRKPHCEAIWDGKDFELPEGLATDVNTMIG